MEKLRALPRTLSSKRGSWIWLGTVLIVFVAMFGAFGRATAPALNATAPANSESTQVAELLKQFPNADQQSVIVVSTANDGAALSPAHLSALKGLLPAIEKETGLAPSGPVPSEDGKAAVIIAPMTLTSDNSENADHLKALREVIADKKTSSSDLNAMQLQVTGGPAFGADIAGAFEGADIQLLLVTIAIVAVLLMLTYRSPVLWLIPLIVVAFADQLAGKVTAWLGTQASLQFDTGIISVLVFGAGTNYALLFISRYREELPRFADHRQALAEAWKRTAPAILASNVTVVIALATLVFAAIPGTRGLGIASAVGLLIALAAVLFALPPVLAIFGRKIFWPFIPRFTESTVESVVELPGELQEEKPKELGKLWRSIATNVVRRPVVCLTAALALLAIMATGLIGSSVGLNQIEKFRVQSESATGLQVLSEHFSPGEAQPMMIVSNSAQAKAVADRAADVSGVVRSQIAGETEDGKLTKIMVTGEYAPGTPESLAQVNDLRNAVHHVPEANALVGGAVATDADARTVNLADFLLVAPLVLGVSFLVLLILLRSLVAPVLLLAANIVSATAAIGAGAWLSRTLFNQPALDLQVPLLAFLFLVALGIDYTIFLVHRAKTEAATHGTREGMVRAVASTDGVITSAGIVLAGVFAALGILPLVTLGQLGLIVGIGVVVDTLVVRTILVPAIFSLLGDKIWWPGKVPAPAVDAEEASAPLGSNANLTAARSAHPAAAQRMDTQSHDESARTSEFIDR
ncbi:MMPL family transporter [Neomicrococcus lactis]